MLYGTIEMSGDANHPAMNEFAFFTAKDDNGEEQLYINPMYCGDIKIESGWPYEQFLGRYALRLSKFDGEISDSEWEAYASKKENSLFLDDDQEKELEEFVRNHGDKLIIKMFGKFWACQSDLVDCVDMGLFQGTRLEIPDSSDKRFQEFSEKSKNRTKNDWTKSGLFINDGEAPYVSIQVANMDDLKVIATGVSPLENKEEEKKKMLKMQTEEQEYDNAEIKAGIVTSQRGHFKKEENDR